jgi:hypothetical protein
MRDFPTLFQGRADAHGYYGNITGAQPTNRGKRASIARSVPEPVTPELFAAHRAGEDRLGIIPVMSDGNVNWFCIDIDYYELGKGFHKSLADAIRDAALPLVMTRTKSGGAHLWCFLEKPIHAREAHATAIAFKEKLNLPHVIGDRKDEIDKHVDLFPKEFTPNSTKDIAVWVNLPYFGEACTATGESGEEELSFDEFLVYANDHIVHPDDLSFKKKEKAKVKNKRSPMPPCIDKMVEDGVEEGQRDHCVTHFAIVHKRAYPDDWQERVLSFNSESVNPPLRSDEVRKIIKSVATKEYDYMCKAVKAFYCDQTECKKREFGIGETVTDIGITNIEKIDGEKPIYRITIDDKKFTCDFKTLYAYHLFRQTAFASINRFLPAMKQGEWEDVLGDLLQSMEITEAAADTEMRDRVIKHFQNWCAQSVTTDDLDNALATGIPYYDGKTSIVFSGDAFMSIIDRTLKIDRDRVYVYMRDWGVVQIDHDTKRLWAYVVKGPLWFDVEKRK